MESQAKSSMRNVSRSVVHGVIGHSVGMHNSHVLHSKLGHPACHVVQKSSTGNPIPTDVSRSQLQHCHHHQVNRPAVDILINGVAIGNANNKIAPGTAVCDGAHDADGNANPHSASIQKPLPAAPETSHEEEPQRGGISVNGRCYLLCDTLGKGGSAEVFRVQAHPTEAEEAASEAERLDCSDSANAASYGENSESNNANSPLAGEMYALKIVFARSKTEFEQFFNEVELLKRCRNQPNVIQIFDFETNPSCFGIFMVMELASEGDLFHYLRNHAEALRLCGDPYIVVEGDNAAEKPGNAIADPAIADGNAAKITDLENEEQANASIIVADTTETVPSIHSKLEFSQTNLTAQIKPESRMKENLPDDIAEQTSIVPSTHHKGHPSTSVSATHAKQSAGLLQFPGGPFIRKEKISLEDFENRCRSVLSVFTQSLTGVRSLHGKKIIHSDLKPANFLVCQQGFAIDTNTAEGKSLATLLGLQDDESTVRMSVVKVADLGLAAVVREGESHVTRGNLIGTQQFMAPEAIFRMNEGNEIGIMEGVEDGKSGLDGLEVGGIVGQMLRKTTITEEELEPRFDKTKIRYASDVWSMGVILFLMMYQRTPYAHLRRLGHCLWMVMLDESVAIQFQPCMLGNVSQEFERLVQICRGCLQHKPSERWNLERIFEEINRDLKQSPYNLDLSPTLQVRGTGTLVEIKTQGPLNAVSAAALTNQSAPGKNDLPSASYNKSTTEPSNTLSGQSSDPSHIPAQSSESSNPNQAGASVTAPANSAPTDASPRFSRTPKKCLVDCRFVAIIAVVASLCVAGLVLGTIYGVAPSLRGGPSRVPANLKDVSTKTPGLRTVTPGLRGSALTLENTHDHEVGAAEASVSARNENKEKDSTLQSHTGNQDRLKSNWKSDAFEASVVSSLGVVMPEKTETATLPAKSPASDFLKTHADSKWSKKSKGVTALAGMGAAIATGVGAVVAVQRYKKEPSRFIDPSEGPPRPSVSDRPERFSFQLKRVPEPAKPEDVPALTVPLEGTGPRSATDRAGDSSGIFEASPSIATDQAVTVSDIAAGANEAGASVTAGPIPSPISLPLVPECMVGPATPPTMSDQQGAHDVSTHDHADAASDDLPEPQRDFGRFMHSQKPREDDASPTKSRMLTLDYLKELVRSGKTLSEEDREWIDFVDDKGRTALMHAASDPMFVNGDGRQGRHETLQARNVDGVRSSLRLILSLEVVRLLLNAGANPNIEDEDGNTALAFATQVPHNHHTIDELITRGVDLENPVHYWAKFTDNMPQVLSVSVTEPNILSKAGLDRIFEAGKFLQAGTKLDLNAIRIALSKTSNGTKPPIYVRHHVRAYAGQTVFHFACSEGREDIVKLMLKHDPKIMDARMLFVPDKNPQAQKLEESERRKKFFPHLPINGAAFKNHLNVVRLLLEAGSMIHTKRRIYDRPSEEENEAFKVLRRVYWFLVAAKRNDVAAVQKALQDAERAGVLKILINVRDEDGFSAFQYAREAQDTTMQNMLTAAGFYEPPVQNDKSWWEESGWKLNEDGEWEETWGEFKFMVSHWETPSLQISSEKLKLMGKSMAQKRRQKQLTRMSRKLTK